MSDLPVSKVVQFGNPADPTADQRRSSNLGVKVFAILLGIPFVVSLIAVTIMNVFTFSGSGGNIVGQTFGAIAGFVVSLALGGLLAAAAIVWDESKPLGIAAAALFLLSLAASLYSAGSFSFVSMVDFPSKEPLRTQRNARFSSEPRQLQTIEDARTAFLQTPIEFTDGYGRHWTANGKQIIDLTHGCSRFVDGSVWEEDRCEEWFRMKREKQARIECNAGLRTEDCGKTSLTSAPGDGLPWISAENKHFARLISAGFSSYVLVFATAVLGTITMLCLHLLMTVKQDVSPIIAPPMFLPGPEPNIERIDHFEEWHIRCVVPDETQKGLPFSAIWQNYKEWCAFNGYAAPPFNEDVFSKRFKALHVNEAERSDGSKYDRLRLKKFS